MNYLAHAYLSFGIPEITVGNLISDFVKGKQKFTYPAAIQQGIVLHRAIDTFTDTHAITAQAKSFFREPYRLYSGAIVDVVYDHFLANDPMEFPGDSLLPFSLDTYTAVQPYSNWLPPKFARMFPYMMQQNWLNNYRYTWGIQRSFEGLVRRSAYLSDSETAFTLFLQNYNRLQQYYNQFFPAIKKFVIEYSGAA